MSKEFELLKKSLRQQPNNVSRTEVAKCTRDWVATNPPEEETNVFSVLLKFVSLAELSQRIEASMQVYIRMRMLMDKYNRVHSI
jgi:hypothetical protein